MRVRYDHKEDILRLITETPDATSASLLDDPGIAVELATEDGHEIVGVTVLGMSAYLPLGNRGYDAETDTLTMGRTAADPELITRNGDLVGYWQVDKCDADGFRDPIGVAIKRASVHLASVSAKMSANLVNAD